MATIREAVELIVKSKGKIMRVTFVKKDKTQRVMVCRLGVRKGVTGDGMKFDPYERGLIPAYDMQKGDWRMINVNTLQEVRALGQTLKVS